MTTVEGSVIVFIGTLFTTLLGWLHMRQKAMQEQLNKHASSHISKNETDQLIKDKTDYVRASVDEMKSDLKEIKDRLLEMTRWQGRQEGKQKTQKD